jgi:hypothetical protein
LRESQSNLRPPCPRPEPRRYEPRRYELGRYRRLPARLRAGALPTQELSGRRYGQGRWLDHADDAEPLEDDRGRGFQLVSDLVVC